MINVFYFGSLLETQSENINLTYFRVCWRCVLVGFVYAL